MNVREATTDDLPELLRMGEMFASCIGASIEYDEASFAETLRGMIENDQATVMVAEGASIVGMIAGLLFPAFFNHAHLTGQELVWWVDPEHRRGRAGIMLFSALEDWAKESGAQTFSMMSIEPLKTDEVNQMYERKGYTVHEHSFIKELTWQ